MGAPAKRIVIKPEQNIVSTIAKEFREKLLEKIVEKNCELEIDLTGVEMIDSVGIGVFIATHNALNKVEGKLNVTHASENIFKLFKTMGLNRHFSVDS